MHTKSSLTPVGIAFGDALVRIASVDDAISQTVVDQPVHVPGVGTELTAAYEQLRNASENIEDHLLFQRAILRFLKRTVDLDDTQSKPRIGSELVVELTQAGYLENDTISKLLIGSIDTLIADLHALYSSLLKHKAASANDASRWVFDLMSVQVEQMFNHPVRTLSFAYVAHTHLTPLVDVTESAVEGERYLKTSIRRFST